MLLQVYNTCLDPQKGWYVLNSDICCSEVRKFSDNFFFRRFPDEIHKVPFRELRDESGNALDPNLFGVKYQKCSVVVASTLGLCGALLRQRELNDQSHLSSDSFKRIAATINNHFATTGLPRNGTSSTVTALQKELEEAKGKIRDLQSIIADKSPASNLSTDEKSAAPPKQKKTRLSKKKAREKFVVRWKMSVLGTKLPWSPVHPRSPTTAKWSSWHNFWDCYLTVTVKKGVKRGLQTLVPDVLQQYMQQFRVQTWSQSRFRMKDGRQW